MAPGDTPCDVTAGADGSIWVSLENQQAFVPGGNLWTARIEPSTGTMRLVSIPHVNDFANPPGSNPPRSLTPGPDGNVWFVISSNHPVVGYITPTGVVKEFTPLGSPRAFTGGPDSNLWCVDYVSGSLECTTPAAVITSFPVPSAHGYDGVGGITEGPDHNLWTLYVTRDAFSTNPYQTYARRISIASWH